MRWTVVIPAKSLPEAKSRLLPATADADAHARLVRAIRSDTIHAAAVADGVARVVQVTDRAGPDGVLVQRRPGLNAALEEAAEHAARHWPADGVVALLADLPALRPEELADVLVVAARHLRSYVPDAEGTGTTLLAARPGIPLDPAFGTDSAARHATAAVTLDAGPGLRRDVDTAADLSAAIALGVGPATAALLADEAVTVRSP